jgi:hypothetical protein
MKFKKIVGFGDSWMWGDELLDPALRDHVHAHPVLMENTPYREQHCFLGRLGQHYEVATENFGIAGGSLQSSIWTYLWWLEHETVPLDQCLVLVALTDSNRHTFYNPTHVSYANDPPWNRFVHSAWVHSGNSSIDDAWQRMVKLHMTLTDCSESNRLNFLQSMLFFQGQRDRVHTLLQFNSISCTKCVPEPSLIWPDTSLSDMIQQDPMAASMLAAQGHPNENGHEWIAKHLINVIDHATITQ